MPKFLTIGYGDEAGYEGTAQSVRDAAHRHDAALLEAGAIIGRADAPLQVRNHDGAEVEVREGAFLSSELPLAGFAIIEAHSLDEAVRLASQAPCAVAQGVVEVWPLELG
ncbi:transcription initiation protein [Aeromicrobium sp. Root495]|uniref:YciI family protein n=1 Tax=Aeromicrobium sp. Root495 TaxID=1736550 RepID=UPI0006FE97DA|nr:YciI family protein [Aeromicrobium sp. Root495]KQY58712.1 transcription initiation protein [Aeromicrobium sp. Root495]